MTRNNIEQFIFHFITNPRVESMGNNEIEGPLLIRKIKMFPLYQGYII